MKVKVLSRNLDECLRETKKDIQKVPRNYDKNLHPFSDPREYIRASNAAKLERVFAKPFFGSLDGHRDVISCVMKHPTKISRIYSGACDGEIRVWNLPRKKCMHTVVAHEGTVQGMCFHPNGEYFFSCGNDKIIKQWRAEGTEDAGGSEEPMNTIIGKDNIMVATCADRGIRLFDIRNPESIRKTILSMRSNSVAWNPQEPIYFTAANEDYNLYTFDMRNMAAPINVHMGHVSAVLDVDYAPTGKEFVSGSYDRTIRIFPASRGNSREVYHTKRMQRVVDVKWSLDNRFVLSASDEMNLRIWKANASEKLGVLRPREKEAFNYSAKLKSKFSAHPQISRIIRHRHVPNAIYAATKEMRIMKDAEKKKEARRRAKSKHGTVPHVPERQKCVVKEIE